MKSSETVLLKKKIASNSVNSFSDGRELFRYFLEFTHAKQPFFSAAAWREIALIRLLGQYNIVSN